MCNQIQLTNRTFTVSAQIYSKDRSLLPQTGIRYASQCITINVLRKKKTAFYTFWSACRRNSKKKKNGHSRTPNSHIIVTAATGCFPRTSRLRPIQAVNATRTRIIRTAHEHSRFPRIKSPRARGHISPSYWREPANPASELLFICRQKKKK